MTLDETLRLIVREELRAALKEIQVAPSSTSPGPTAKAAGAVMMTVGDVAERCQVRPETVRGWVHSGELIARKTGRHLRVRPSDFEAFLSSVDTSGAPTINSDVHLRLLTERARSVPK